MTTATQIRAAVHQAWKASGLSKAALSRKIGKNKNYLNDVFSGRITPAPDVLDAIAAATQNEPVFFFRDARPLTDWSKYREEVERGLGEAIEFPGFLIEKEKTQAQIRECFDLGLAVQAALNKII